MSKVRHPKVTHANRAAKTAKFAEQKTSNARKASSGKWVQPEIDPKTGLYNVKLEELDTVPG